MLKINDKIAFLFFHRIISIFFFITQLEICGCLLVVLRLLFQVSILLTHSNSLLPCPQLSVLKIGLCLYVELLIIQKPYLITYIQ